MDIKLAKLLLRLKSYSNTVWGLFRADSMHDRRDWCWILMTRFFDLILILRKQPHKRPLTTTSLNQHHWSHSVVPHDLTSMLQQYVIFRVWECRHPPACVAPILVFARSGWESFLGHHKNRISLCCYFGHPKEEGGILYINNERLGQTILETIPCTNFPSVFRAKRRLTSHSASEVASQSRTSGCLVTCWPSAADEKWYSSKRLSSTVAVNSHGLNTKASAIFR